MAKSGNGSLAQPMKDVLLPLTGDSPLLLVGTVQNRMRFSRKSDRGPWEMFKVEVRGCDGRCVTAIVNEPKKIPEKGEFLVLPVFVGNNGQLREAKNLAQGF